MSWPCGARWDWISESWLKWRVVVQFIQPFILDCGQTDLGSACFCPLKHLIRPCPSSKSVLECTFLLNDSIRWAARILCVDPPAAVEMEMWLLSRVVKCVLIIGCAAYWCPIQIPTTTTTRAMRCTVMFNPGNLVWGKPSRGYSVRCCCQSECTLVPAPMFVWLAASKFLLHESLDQYFKPTSNLPFAFNVLESATWMALQLWFGLHQFLSCHLFHVSHIVNKGPTIAMGRSLVCCERMICSSFWLAADLSQRPCWMSVHATQTWAQSPDLSP